MELKKLIIELENNLENLKNKYLSSEKPEDRRDKEFFNIVKQETTPIYNRIQQWEIEALAFVKQRSVKVHPQQVVSTSENLELLLMHSYYIDVKRKRYMELNQSVQYVFDLLKSDIEE